MRGACGLRDVMVPLKFERLTEGNVRDALYVCNTSLPYDLLNPATLRRITFDDPNYEPGLALIAYGDDGPLGFAVGCRRIKEPAEYVNPKAGWIKLIAAIDQMEGGVLDHLCQKVETELKGLGVEAVRLTDFASWHLWAGIDIRYESLLQMLERRGYSKVGEAIDYLIDLRAFAVPRRIRALGRALEGQGISIALATEKEGQDLGNWVKMKFGAGWAYEVATSLRNALKNGSGTLVAREGMTGEVIGFSTHGALEPHWFGPIGVDERRRKSGVGSALLFESLRLMRLNGIAEAVIPWTSHLFFYTQVPGIVGLRHYYIMGKKLA
jgi:hypothetical protein